VEDQPDTSSAVTPVKLDRLRKSAIRSLNKITIYNVYKFFKDISVILISALNGYKRRYQTNYLVVLCDVVPVAAQNHRAVTVFS
jgi:hypothetical protein